MNLLTHLKGEDMKRIVVLVLSSVALFVFIVPTIHAESDVVLSSAEGINQAAFIKDRQSPHERFVRSDTGVVEDKYLGLEWVVGPKKDTTWDEAKSWVESRTVDGDGWRMPTRNELRSLYQEGALSNHISPAFKTYCRFVWTGEKVGPAYAWGFCFASGQEFWPRCDYSQGTRAFAVRSQRTK
jgi:hypothetical protein